jgi:hypothetical protein
MIVVVQPEIIRNRLINYGLRKAHALQGGRVQHRAFGGAEKPKEFGNKIVQGSFGLFRKLQSSSSERACFKSRGASSITH